MAKLTFMSQTSHLPDTLVKPALELHGGFSPDYTVRQLVPFAAHH